MKKRYKPKCDELYYSLEVHLWGMVVVRYTWRGDNQDKFLYKNNLVFKNAAKAQAAIKKLKRFIKEEL